MWERLRTLFSSWPSITPEDIDVICSVLRTKIDHLFGIDTAGSQMTEEWRHKLRTLVHLRYKLEALAEEARSRNEDISYDDVRHQNISPAQLRMLAGYFKDNSHHYNILSRAAKCIEHRARREVF